MRKLPSISLFALLSPALALSTGTALAEDRSATNPTAAETRQAPRIRDDAHLRQAADAKALRAHHAAGNPLMVNAPAGATLATDMIGTALRSPENDEFGAIEDFIVDREGQIQAVVVGVGGFLSLGERQVAIPWNDLERSVNNDGEANFEVDMTEEALRDRPAYDGSDSTTAQPD